jgi:hypothetical protein
MNLEGFYRGVVEDNVDPSGQGKCRIRIVDVHSPELSELSTESLPWCEPAGSLFCGSVQGIGVSSVPLNGSWVWCFFDRGDFSKPVYFATSIGGVYESQPLAAYGFRDSYLFSGNSQYTYPRQDRMTWYDYNPLMKGNVVGTSHEIINSNLISGDGMQEPSSTSNNAVYPYNNVIETQSGHTIEIDDTKGNERIKIFHKSGTYIELKPDGTNVVHNQGDYIICTKTDLMEIVQGEVKRLVQKNISEHIVGNLTLNVDGDVNWNIGGKVTISSGGNYKVTAPRIDLN